MEDRKTFVKSKFGEKYEECSLIIVIFSCLKGKVIMRRRDDGEDWRPDFKPSKPSST